MCANVAESLVIHVENTLDVAESLGAGGGGIDHFDQIGLFDARRVEFEGAGFLAKLGDLHGRKLLAGE